MGNPEWARLGLPQKQALRQNLKCTESMWEVTLGNSRRKGGSGTGKGAQVVKAVLVSQLHGADWTGPQGSSGGGETSLS